jgi:photosystem II stability/assembly factor-like uncharacterized protein
MAACGPAWVIIGKLVSLVGRRLVATLGALWVLAVGSLGVHAGALPNSTWVALKPLPQQGHTAVFALAVDPSNNQSVLAGNSAGSLFRSTDGGSTWTSVHAGTAVVTTIAFSPLKAGLVLAGTHGGGALVSHDGGQTWSPVVGLERRTVRAFGFALTVTVAGTDHGVYSSQDAVSWLPAGLSDRNINSLAVEAIHAPVHLVAGTDSTTSSAGLQLFQSNDAGLSWTPFSPPVSGTFAVKLAAGPLPPTGNIRPLLLGTNAGLFESNDNGGSFTPLSGGDLLPSTDYTQLTFVTDHYDRFYAASDGGGSGAGGLWRTDDTGRTFRSLEPPTLSITGLAVSNDEEPVLYVAAFRPSDHVAELWGYHDTGNFPQGPVVTPSPFASGSRTSTSGTALPFIDVLTSSQLPYVALGVAALGLIVTAMVAQIRSRGR